jgi:chromosomal replication initiation ATPase DnaA
MVKTETYKLFGYIEYVTSPVGFVTPVFVNDQEEYYIQATSAKGRENLWEVLPQEYIEVIKSISTPKVNDNPITLLYGFKWREQLFFGSGMEMEDYLTKHFLPNTHEGKNLAVEFIKDWKNLEHQIDSFSKEIVWKECLDFVGSQSRTFPRIFAENFEVLEYKDSTLILEAKNESVKDVFELKFINEIITHIREYNPYFKIEIKSHQQKTLNALPTTYQESSNSFYIQGSYLHETKINPSKEFNTFIVGNFNAKAYQYALDITQKMSSFFLIIRGEAGTGKSHLTHSIAKQLSQSQERKKVVIFNVQPIQNQTEKNIEFDVEKFKTIALENDVIMIDDLQNINFEKSNFQKLIKILKFWRGMNKSIVLTYRSSFHIEMLSDLTSTTYQELILTPPNELDKLLLIESKVKYYNLNLDRKDLVRLSEDKEVISVRELQKQLLKTYLTQNIKSRFKNPYLTYYKEDFFTSIKVDACVSRYFETNLHTSILPVEKSFSNVKLVSYFIQDIFSESKVEDKTEVENRFQYSLYYSLDSLQDHLFNSNDFKEAVITILLNLLNGSIHEE